MAFQFRSVSILAGLALAAFAASASARDYVVVSSTDPSVARGQAFDAGARVPLAAGSSVVLMHATGDLLRLKGAAGGVVLPRRAASQGDADRLAILKVIVAPPGRQARGQMVALSSVSKWPCAHLRKLEKTKPLSFFAVWH